MPIRQDQARSQATVQELLDMIQQGSNPPQPKPPPIDHTRDVELPNQSGQIDPRLQAPQQAQSIDDITARINELMGAPAQDIQQPQSPARRRMK